MSINRFIHLLPLIKQKENPSLRIICRQPERNERDTERSAHVFSKKVLIISYSLFRFELNRLSRNVKLPRRRKCEHSCARLCCTCSRLIVIIVVLFWIKTIQHLLVARNFAFCCKRSAKSLRGLIWVNRICIQNTIYHKLLLLGIFSLDAL